MKFCFCRQPHSMMRTEDTAERETVRRYGRAGNGQKMRQGRETGGKKLQDGRIWSVKITA